MTENQEPIGGYRTPVFQAFVALQEAYLTAVEAGFTEPQAMQIVTALAVNAANAGE